MKKIIALTLIALLQAFATRAQEVVYDPIMNIEQIIDETENIAKYVTMIDNQVQEIKQLKDQVTQLTQINTELGNASQITSVTGVSAVTSDLSKTSLGQTISAVQQSANGVAALTYDANGLYKQIGASFTTPSGNQIQRNAADYKPNEAINNATANYSTVTADVLQRRQALKQAIASTTESLQSATTVAEVQKLTGVLMGQNATLSASDKEIDQAVAVSVEQDIENRNDRQKQATAAQEEQKAEVVETFDNYRTNFQLSAQPPVFPTGNQ